MTSKAASKPVPLTKGGQAVLIGIVISILANIVLYGMYRNKSTEAANLERLWNAQVSLCLEGKGLLPDIDCINNLFPEADV